MRQTTISARRICLATTLLATLLCLSAPGRADEPLRWKFKVGEKLGCNISNVMTIAMNTSPTERKNTIVEQIMDITLDVQGVNEAGEAVIVVKFDRIQSKISDPDPVEYDTAKDTPTAGKAMTYAPLYKAMSQGEFEVTMSARGQIKDVKVPAEVLAVLKNSQPAMGDLATPKGLQDAIMNWAFVLPEGAPKLGERSTGSVDVNNPMGITVETSYTYDGVKDVDGKKYARFLPAVKMNLEGTPTMRFKVKDQKSDGEVLFNIDQGRLETMQRQENVSMDVTITGQTMPGQLTQNIQVKVTPK